MKLTAKNVKETLVNCLFAKGEDMSNPVFVEGIREKLGFNPTRVKENESNISEMIDQLPDAFKSTVGGGWSFLNACVDKDGNQWGDHSDIDRLACLGLAINKISFLLPREMWMILPGGIPYIVINESVTV